MVGFGYFHPLMGLIDYQDIRKQIQMHKEIFTQNFPGAYSKGIFPPENAFSDRMIPALVDEGIEWALVDNIHFERAVKNYPFDKGGNLYEPNKADLQVENPNDWIAYEYVGPAPAQQDIYARLNNLVFGDLSMLFTMNFARSIT